MLIWLTFIAGLALSLDLGTNFIRYRVSLLGSFSSLLFLNQIAAQYSRLVEMYFCSHLVSDPTLSKLFLSISVQYVPQLTTKKEGGLERSVKKFEELSVNSLLDLLELIFYMLIDLEKLQLE